MNYNLDDHKLAYHVGRVEAHLCGERVAPITIDCSLSTACNYKCVYCYGQFQKQAGFESANLPRKVIMDFLEDCAHIGVKAVSIVSDGESTCNPQLVDAITFAKELGLDVALGTNGYALPMDHIEELLSCLTYLRFNISATDDRYNKVHHGPSDAFETVWRNILQSVTFKRLGRLSCTVAMQAVVYSNPDIVSSIIPLALLAKNLGVDYLVFKHCSDYQDKLQVNHHHYASVARLLLGAEAMSTPTTQISAKWGKMGDGKERSYTRCYGPPLQLQISGSGLVAPCGMLFADEFAEYHIGNLRDTRLRDLIASPRYWEVMGKLADGTLDLARCGSLCLQHRVNEALWNIKHEAEVLTWREATEDIPHVNFL